MNQQQPTNAQQDKVLLIERENKVRTSFTSHLLADKTRMECLFGLLETVRRMAEKEEKPTEAIEVIYRHWVEGSAVNLNLPDNRQRLCSLMSLVAFLQKLATDYADFNETTDYVHTGVELEEIELEYKYLLSE